MSEAKLCLNCNKELTGNFCSNCGQSAEVDRFTIKYVFVNGFLNKFFYYDNGLISSLKELFTRPGHSIREYNQGKRMGQMDYLSLLAIFILLFSLAESYTSFHYADLSNVDGEGKKILNSFDDLLKKHPKLLMIGYIPAYSLLSFWIFRKAQQNYAEHFVLNCFRSSALLLLNIIFILSTSFIHNLHTILKIEKVLDWIVLAYGTFFYYQYFSPFYKNHFMLLLRSVLCNLLPVGLATIGIALYLIINDPAFLR